MISVPGFTHLSTTDVSEISSSAHMYRHDKTGARILSMSNEDTNKVFGIAFRTPPKDSTGVAHILEHSVLCGSRKYPLKEPFVELLKGSLQTFLNAMTFPDKTCYPVASQNSTDFYNLVDVYLDAVFFPRITPEIFEQEGWHLDLEQVGQSVALKGVVYNEMKGVYSSPDSMLAELSQQSLFPETTYGLDSGGKPAVISELTYEQFKDFHQKYYHPSNAWIFFYGDDDPQKRLEKLAEYLDQFEALTVDSAVSCQPAFTKPQEIQASFEGSATDARGMLTLNWLLPDKADPEIVLACKILDGLLTGLSASPLRKALLDSGLGEDLTGCGLELDLAQMYYSVGLKGVRPEDFSAVSALIYKTLREICAAGFDAELLEAAINSMEFDLRENNSGSYPRGLLVMLAALGTWLYDENDPLSLVRFEKPLNSIKNRLAQGERVFEELLMRFLLENTHHCVVKLHPEEGYAKGVEEEEEQRISLLRQKMAHLSESDLVKRTQELRALQEAPDSPEALATIPVLQRSDIDPKVYEIPTDIHGHDGVTVLRHELLTNDIAYVDLAFDLSFVPERLLPLIPLFSRALTEMGTNQEDYVSFSKRIARKTGGLSIRTLVSPSESGKIVACLVVRAKAVSAQVQSMLEIVRDALLQVSFADRQRFRQIVLEEKAGMEQSLVPAGHQYVALRLRGRLHPAEALQDTFSGIEQLKFLRALALRLDQDWGAVQKDLETLQQLIVRSPGAVLNLTMDADMLRDHEQTFVDFLGEFPRHAGQPESWSPGTALASEGFFIPAQVNYVGKACSLSAQGYTFHASSLVAAKYLRTTWLWEQVRVLGGAYGGFCGYGRLTELMHFGSYRDPNIASTLKAFDGCGAFLETVRLDSQELLKAVIGTSGDLDPYQLPDSRGFTAMVRYITGVTHKTRQNIRDEVLGTEETHLRTFGTALREACASGLLCVLGSEEAMRRSGVEFTRTERLL